MTKIKQSPTKEERLKWQDALAKSSYAIIRERKETKSALEKSKRGLLAAK